MPFRSGNRAPLATSFNRGPSAACIAIARSAAFFGCSSLLIGEGPNHAMPSPAAYRTAEGGLEHLNLYRTRDLPRALAVLVGFGGVVLAMRPTSASFSLPALVAITGCMLFALIMLITRHLRGTKGIVLVSWQAGGALIFGLVTAPMGWVPPTPRDFILLGLLGVVSTIAHISVNRALKLAPASVVMPYQYSQIIWAVLLGYLVFGDWPDNTMLMGSGIIVAAGLFIFFREQAQAAKLRRAEA